MPDLAKSIAAHESWAKTPDRSKRTKPAREALWQRFLADCDGDPVRAEHAWKAHFKRLALKSAQALRKACEATAAAEAAEAELVDLGEAG